VYNAELWKVVVRTLGCRHVHTFKIFRFSKRQYLKTYVLQPKEIETTENMLRFFAQGAWSRYVVVSFPPATEETGATGREIEPRQGICRVVVFKKMLTVKTASNLC
jgi:hypothetical protein